MTADDSPTDAEILEQLKRYATKHPFVERMDLSFETYEDGFVHATAPYLEEFASPADENYELPEGPRPLHGGMVCSILDTVMGFAIMGQLIEDDRSHGPTISLNVDFISSANGPLDVFANPIRIGGSIASVRGELYHRDTETPVAAGQGVWRVF